MDSLIASPVTLGLLVLNVIASLIALNNRTFMNQNMLWIAPMRDDHQWYRLISSGFIHVATWHLLLNMVTLYSLGPIIEHVFGGVSFAMIYFAALLGGNIWAFWFNQSDDQYQAVGASGAISGIVLAFCMLAPFQILLIGFVIPLWGIVAGPTIIILSYVLAQREDRVVGHEAHLGGAVAGVITTLLVRPETCSQFVGQLAQRFG